MEGRDFVLLAFTFRRRSQLKMVRQVYNPSNQSRHLFWDHSRTQKLERTKSACVHRTCPVFCALKCLVISQSRSQTLTSERNRTAPQTSPSPTQALLRLSSRRAYRRSQCSRYSGYHSQRRSWVNFSVWSSHRFQPATNPKRSAPHNGQRSPLSWRVRSMLFALHRGWMERLGMVLDFLLLFLGLLEPPGRMLNLISALQLYLMWFDTGSTFLLHSLWRLCSSFGFPLPEQSVFYGLPWRWLWLAIFT